MKQLAKLVPFERSLRSLLAVIAHNGSADSASLLHLGSDRRLQVTASADCSEPPVHWTFVEIQDGVLSWLERVTAPEIVSLSRVARYGENGAAALLRGWEAAAVALVGDVRDARFFLHVGWRRHPADDDVNEAFGLLGALSRITARIAQVRELQELVAEVTRAESELADSKIAERAVGLLTSSLSGPIASEPIRLHVERVLQGVDESAHLQDRLEQVRKELSGRQAIARAKQALQQ